MPVAGERIPGPFSFPDYRRFWVARFCAVMGTIAMVVIIGWQVYDLARTDYGMSPREAAFQLGLLGAIQFVPLALMTPVAGWAADRFERRSVARFANAIDLSIALVLGIATYTGSLSLPLLFVLAALHGVARVFIGPSMSAIAPNIVPSAVLPRAIATSSIAWQSASVIGPAAAGFLYAANPAGAYWMAVALLLVSIGCLSFIQPVHPPGMGTATKPFQQMVDGLRYTWRDRFLLGAITLDLFAVLFAGATALLPVFARDILHVGPEGLGQLRAAPALGAAIVALWLAWRPLATNVGVKMLWAVVVFGLATAAFGLVMPISQAIWGDLALVPPAWPGFAPGRAMGLALLFLFVIGASDMLSVFVRSSLVQLNTPDAVRGRVSAVSGLAISASNELGELQSGIAAALLGAAGAVVFGGAAAIAITAAWAILFPELRNARTFTPQFKEHPR